MSWLAAAVTAAVGAWAQMPGFRSACTPSPTCTSAASTTCPLWSGPAGPGSKGDTRRVARGPALATAKFAFGKDRTGTVCSDKDSAYEGMRYYGVDPKRKRTPSPPPGPGPSPDSSTASRPSAKSGAEPKPSATGMANPPEPGQPWWSSEWGAAVVAVGAPLLLFAAPSGCGVAVGTSVTVGGVTLYELAA